MADLITGLLSGIGITLAAISVLWIVLDQREEARERASYDARPARHSVEGMWARTYRLLPNDPIRNGVRAELEDTGTLVRPYVGEVHDDPA